MRTTILALIAALAFTGVARADDINTITLTGSIVGGFNSGPNGTNDDAGLFGGVDLLNTAISVTVSYDTTYMQNNFGYTNDGVGYSEALLYGNIQNPSQISSPFQMSVTIGGISFGVTGTFYDDMQLCSASDIDCGLNSGAIAAEDFTSNMILVYYSNSDSAITGYDVNNPSDVSAAFNNPDNTYNVFIANGPGGPDAYDSLLFSASSGQPTPEPATWLLLFTGLCGMATLKFRRGAGSR
jgi:hypothetical protein